MGHGGATISLFVLCADRCLCCGKVVACRERDMAYATILVRFVYFITGIDTGTADEESWEGGARITGCLIFRLVYRILSFCIVIVVLAPSGDRAVPASMDCMIFVCG